MSKIAFTGGGCWTCIGQFKFNSNSYDKGHDAFYIGSKTGIEREMIESQLPTLNIIQYLVVNYVDIYQLIMRKRI